MQNMRAIAGALAVISALIFIAACSDPSAETRPQIQQPANPSVAGEPVTPVEAPGSEPLPGAEDQPPIAPPGAGSAIETVISAAELSSHSTESDCWIVYEGKVYDITLFLAEHPGGSGGLSSTCGTADQFSEKFSGRHGTSKVDQLREVGVLKGDFIG